MQTDYPICWNRETVGHAKIVQQGMYYLVKSNILGNVPEPCRLVLFTNGTEMDLGICPRTEQGFGMTMRLPISAVDVEKLSLHIHSADKHTSFYEINPQKQVPYLSELKNARFAIENAKPGIIIHIKD